MRREYDPRIQAIRCLSCRRLRAHPKKDDARTWNCGCGGIRFVETFPHDDEMPIALRLYGREIEEGNVYSAIAQELILGKGA